MAQKNLNTKDKLLDSAMNLMLKKGFTATTLDDICENAGVTKGSFFHYFTNKEDLGIHVLTYYTNDFLIRIQDKGIPNISDPVKRLETFLDFIIDLFHQNIYDKSCLVGNLSQEISNTHEPIRIVCSDIFNLISGIVNEMLKEMKYKLKPHVEIETMELSDTLIALIQGSALIAKAHQNGDIMKISLFHYKQYILNLFSI